MRRRSLLTAVSAVVTGGVAGCLSDAAPAQSTATYTRVAPSLTPVRGRGEPISVDRSLSDEPGYEDDREYFPANKTVRYVAATSGGEPVDFETISFEEWAPTKSTEVGMKRAQEMTATRLGTDEFTAGMDVPPETAQTEGLVIWLTVATGTRVVGPVVGQRMPVHVMGASHHVQQERTVGGGDEGRTDRRSQYAGEPAATPPGMPECGRPPTRAQDVRGRSGRGGHRAADDDCWRRTSTPRIVRGGTADRPSFRCKEHLGQ